MTLNRLSIRESLAMLSHLLGTEDIDRDLEELILEKTEGVPFFIEEFVRSLKDMKIIERRNSKYHLAKEIQDVTIPSTIQDVIMARVDSLPEGTKELLQTGSVIEREFSYELIKHVTNMPEKELLANLSVLKDSELLYERGIYPQSAYIFRHALTQEVAYDSILARRRKSLHEKIGNAIEELYRDNLEEHYGVLAEHYIASENYEKGAEYSKLAGKKAEKTASFPNAIEYAEKGVACLERLDQTDDVQKKIIDARTTLGLYYMQLDHYVEAKEAVDPIVDLAIRRDYRRRPSQVFTIIGTHSYSVEEDLDKALKYLNDALKLSNKLNDVLSLVMANYWMGIGLAINCDYEKALIHMGKALEINEALNVLYGISAMKSVISCFVYNFQGKIDLGYQTSEEALRIAEESADIYSKAFAYTYHGCSCYYKGFLEEGEEHLMKGATLSERLSLYVCGATVYSLLGYTYFDIGEYKKSEDYFLKANSLLEHLRHQPSWVNHNRICIARARIMRNEKGVDLQALYKYMDENRLRFYEGWMSRNIGEVLLNADDQHMSEAENWIRKAIQGDERNGMMWYLGKDYVLYAELFKRKGDLPKARENLGKALEILKECGADEWVNKYEAELAEL